MLTPEVHATRNTRISDENRPVVLPLFYPFGRTRNCVENGLFTFCFAKNSHELFTGKPIVAGHFADELSHLRRAVVIACGRLLH